MVKLDGYSPDEFGLVFLKDHYHPATPEMRNRTMTIPGMPGEWDFGSEWGSRPFNLPFAVIEYDRYELQRKLRAFVAFLMDAYGKPREIRLSFDYEPDKYYSVKVAGKVDVERAIHTGQFSLSLIAHKPMANFIVPTDEISWDSDIPFTADISLDSQYVYDITAPTTINIINDGLVSVKPLILISGTASSLTMQYNAQKFSFGSISAPALVPMEIDVERYTVRINGVPTLSALTGPIEKMFLYPSDNAISVDGTDLNIKLTFRFNHQYI
ncbi:phage tail family protein [Mesobacillus subterraneus]|uniref:phage tail domain-containing protein n=1 Tax=Mesobacillus subterraneus TaxID=285983 RepID=UPI00203A94A8|nr:phage tail domain-containing protein [Mesobacillus subterraneus]MCM3665506.1 phage tail family protein [Mesobacillus subterraneus]MCM3686065.1 phage tail family protein [Mesobacillus subterraneus]